MRRESSPSCCPRGNDTNSCPGSTRSKSQPCSQDSTMREFIGNSARRDSNRSARSDSTRIVSTLRRDSCTRAFTRRNSTGGHSPKRDSKGRDSARSDSTLKREFVRVTAPQVDPTRSDSMTGSFSRRDFTRSDSVKKDSSKSDSLRSAFTRRDSPRSLKSQDSGYEGGLRSLEDSDSGDSLPGKRTMGF